MLGSGRRIRSSWLQHNPKKMHAYAHKYLHMQMLTSKSVSQIGGVLICSSLTVATLNKGIGLRQSMAVLHESSTTRLPSDLAEGAVGSKGRFLGVYFLLQSHATNTGMNQESTMLLGCRTQSLGFQENTRLGKVGRKVGTEGACSWATQSVVLWKVLALSPPPLQKASHKKSIRILTNPDSECTLDKYLSTVARNT